MEAPSRPLLEQVVRLWGSDGNYIGTATAISPTIVLTVARLVENHQEYFVDRVMVFEGSRSLDPIQRLAASVIARDDETGFAALEVGSALQLSLRAKFLSAEKPARGSKWETLHHSPDGEMLLRRSGEIHGSEQFGGQSLAGKFIRRNLLRLSPSGSGAEGAPVIVNDQMVGLMTGQTLPEYSLAIPLTEIMKSPAWKLVEAAMHAPVAAIPDDQPVQRFRVTRERLNLREGPATSARVIRVLAADNVLEKRGESRDHGWFLVRAEKDGEAFEGWVSTRYLEAADGPVLESKDEPATTPPPFSTAPFDGVFGRSRLEFVKRLTDSGRSALAHATGIRVEQRQSEIHMEHLIAGLFQKEDGPMRTELRRAGIDQDQLAEVVKEAVGTTLPVDYTPFLITDELSPLSPHVEQALSAAAAFADESGSKSIRSRHLLRGAFSVADCAVIQALIRHGVDPEKLRLEPESEQQTDREPARRRPTQAGIKSDDPNGQDLLDIKHEVEALCTVLASKDVKPPISLGLFGDWGSGKSFFMKKMEARFNQLADLARKEDSSYCKNIVQLWFNAWHYMDTNLWASLAKEIFDKLAQELARQDALDKGTQDPDYLRAQLVAKRASANEAVAKAGQEKRDADAKVRVSEQQLASLQSGETAVALSPQAVLREGYRFAKQQPEVGKLVVAADEMIDEKVKEAAKTLNIEADTASLREQLLELRGLWGPARAIWLAVRNARSKWLWLLSAVFLLLALGVLLLPLVLDLAWLQSAGLRVVTVAVSLLAAVAPFVPAARRALQIIHGAIKSSQESIEQAKLQAEKKLELEHQQLQEKALQAQDTLEQAVQDARDVSEKLDNLRADRQMSNFIRQRQQSSDYASYLGVIAKARSDFEQLSTLLAKEQERSEKAQDERRRKKRQAAELNSDGQKVVTEEDERLLPRIDRIILYIDDLDRCPENKVVDVLQAVHLLLAFPLFVVVVGVDPRWLLHSLRQHSKAFQNQIENDQALAEERTQWRSTPLNYLEKIFQIPFTLRPMGAAGFGNMIETLTKPPETDKSTEVTGELKDGELKDGESGPTAGEFVKPEAAAPVAALGSPAAVAGAQIQASVAAPVSKEPPAAAAPVAEASTRVADPSWTSKFFGFLRNAFRKGSESKVAAASADSTRQQAAVGPGAAAAATAVSQAAPEAGAAATPGEQTHTRATGRTLQADLENIEPRPDHLLINSWEQTFMKQLHELIPSPRATKRFINIYRLIRASVDLDDKLRLEDFTGTEREGKYRPVLLLLAILTGYPDQATEILRELLENEHKESWWEFVASFKGRAERSAERSLAATNGRHAAPDDSEKTAAKAAVSTLNATISTPAVDALETVQNPMSENGTPSDQPAGALNDADAESWKQLLEKLEHLRHLFGSAETCSDFVEWAPKVARYSFQSGRVLLTRGGRDPEQKTGAE